jgi:secretion/DNA translocation related TadE-like protein
LRSERGSGTLLTLFTGLLLATALAVATLWSAVSVARHKLTAAADLAALSAAQYLNVSAAHTLDTDPTAPCATAARIAALHDATLTTCKVTPEAVTVQLSTQLHLANLAHPTLTTTSRAGPA